MNDEDADTVREHMNWNALVQGLKPHESIHKVVVHFVPKNAIDLTDPQTIGKLTEANLYINSDAIADINYDATQQRSNTTPSLCPANIRRS
jgi:hypothetical protein